MTAGPAGGEAADGRVAGYLGRVLADGDTPVGTCFQVATGVLVTAWHVLNDIGAAAQDASVRVDPAGWWGSLRGSGGTGGPGPRPGCPHHQNTTA